MRIVVGISDMKVSNNKEDVLITYSLGSCIGLTLYDPVVGVGGLMHSMLPLSKIDSEKAKKCPYMFTDTGVVALLKVIFELGAKRKNIIAKVTGGATFLDDKNLFKIGERNYIVLRKVLWKNNILISGEDVGGTISRTVLLEMATGTTIVKSGNVEKEL